MEKIIFCWSGGKDSSLALYEAIHGEKYEVVALLTNVTEEYDRIAMHGVRRSLLEAQSNSIGIPLDKIMMSRNASNEEYESKVKTTLEKYKQQGIIKCGFGDIFLEDVKSYRDKDLAGIGMEGLYPIWRKDSKELADKFISLGFKAIITCVDTEQISQDFAGRIYDQSFLADLPATVDPCGENGEFHSFVYAGPLFKEPVPVKTGEKLLRDNRFYYCDIL